MPDPTLNPAPVMKTVTLPLTKSCAKSCNP
jgi:hypothetical protein